MERAVLVPQPQAVRGQPQTSPKLQRSELGKCCLVCTFRGQLCTISDYDGYHQGAPLPSILMFHLQRRSSPYFEQDSAVQTLSCQEAFPRHYSHVRPPDLTRAVFSQRRGEPQRDSIGHETLGCLTWLRQPVGQAPCLGGEHAKYTRGDILTTTSRRGFLSGNLPLLPPPPPDLRLGSSIGFFGKVNMASFFSDFFSHSPYCNRCKSTTDTGKPHKNMLLRDGTPLGQSLLSVCDAWVSPLNSKPYILNPKP